MQKTVVWKRIDAIGVEVLQVAADDTGVVAEGKLVVDLGEGGLWLDYRVDCDLEWAVRKVEMHLERPGRSERLTLSRAAGGWHVNEQRLDRLADARYIDISVTPFTNSLPVNGLNLRPGEERPIDVVYVSVPDLHIELVQQAYRRLDDKDPPNRFLYKGLFRGFEGEVIVDDHGLVDEYPGMFRRVATL